MPDQSIISYNNYLTGGGEMGELTRTFDWSKTAIGTPDNWPQSLLTTVNIILNSRFPMVLLWGEDLIQFYNDAYLPTLDNTGKHPKAFGQRAEECWVEEWPIMKPIIDRVLTTGEPTWGENQLIPMYRNNKLEDVYWTFSYSRVIDETGKAAGMLAISNETTAQVKSFNELEDAKKDLEFTLDAAELGTWDFNPKTYHFIGNDRLKSWFGVEKQHEVDLKDALEVIIEEDRVKVTDAILKALEKGSDGNYSIVYTIQNPKDKVKRIVAAKGKAMFDSDGNATRFSGILEDVTEDYQLQLRKDEFISVASHELKTPITSISASMQILQKFTKTENLPDKVSLFINKASNNLNKLVHLLDDLLNVTKIQQGQLALNKTSFNLTELTHRWHP
jgi:PAS domain-containing protein